MIVIPTSCKQGILVITIFISVLSALLGSSLQVSAHGGEDHDDSPKHSISPETKIITQVVHTGEFEVTLRHKPFEPDTRTSAQLFITNYKTNAPIENAKISLFIEKDGKQEAEVLAKPTESIGIMMLELLPVAQGTVKLNIKVDAGGKSERASFGTIVVEPQKSDATSAVQNDWTRTAFLSIAAIFALSIIISVSFFAIKRYQSVRNNHSPEVEKEIVSV